MSDRLNGRQYWQSFEQRAQGSAAADSNEFPGYDPNEIASMPRRRFMKLAAASMAVAGVGLTGCRRWPKEHLVPSTAGLRDQTPGVPEFYATGMEHNGVAAALLVTSYDGRPIKIEGNPLHPLFATWWDKAGKPIAAASDAYAQASVLDLYDPTRSKQLYVGANTKQPKVEKWDAFLAAFEQVAQGAGGNIAVLSESSSGLAHAAAREAFKARFPSALWVEYEPLARDAEVEAGQIAFEKPVRAIYHLDKAKTIVSLDADLFGRDPNHIRHASDWAKGRRSADADKSMNRLYIAETTFSATGTAADHRLPVRPSLLTLVALGLAAAVGVPGISEPAGLTEAHKKWIAAAAADLTAGSGVVAAGSHVSSQVQALAHAINFAIKSVGSGVTFHELPGAQPQINDLRQLTDRMTADQIGGLLILGGNPVYNAPAEIDFAGALTHVRLSAHLSTAEDETSRACTWHLPRSHYLEAWGDARAWDGSVIVQQPLIQPLYDTRSAIELVAMLAKSDAADGQTLVRNAVSKLAGASDEAGWRTALHDGVVKDSAYPVATLAAPKSPSAAIPGGNSDFELRFVEGGVYDGRYANNGWLQEAPDPITKLVWDNAALINKTDADALKVEDGDMLKIELAGKSIEIPAFILWGQPKGVITLPLGYGRTAAGPVGGDTHGTDQTEPVGFDTYKIRRSSQMFIATGGVKVSKGDGEHELVSTQDHQPMDWVGMKGYVDRVGRKNESGRIIRETSLAAYAANPDFVDHVGHRLPLLQLWDSPYPSLEKQAEIAKNDPGAPRAFNVPHAWGMAIDMSTCTGCNACVIACQSENNIPTVGKAMVKMNREMHWIRIDRYFKAKMDEARHVEDYENVDITYQVMMCVHCENAPCEQVCPVAATVHDTEGLNTMVYNRCIGTRYCSNNCPYKVRRFNYLDWHSRSPRKGAGLELIASAWPGIPDTQQQNEIEQVRRMVYNPEVTVRMRGVMEKCTYCTQRIKAATITKKTQWAKGMLSNPATGAGQPAYTLNDFEVMTACQQACATQAITFGNLMDPGSAVRQLHKVPRTYTVLEDLNTRARTRHMAKIRNPSEMLASAAGAEAAPAAAASGEHHG